MDDGCAALDLVARPSLLVGFSMGGAVSIGIASHPNVTGVLGLAPWIPERLSLEGLRGKRFDVVHGSWDRYLPGIPGCQRRELANRASNGCRRSASRAPTRSFPMASTGPRSGAGRARSSGCHGQRVDPRASSSTSRASRPRVNELRGLPPHPDARGSGRLSGRGARAGERAPVGRGSSSPGTTTRCSTRSCSRR